MPRLAVLLPLLAAACAAGVEPVPVRGELPGTIAVWPHVAPAFAPARELLLTGLDGAVRRRGHRVVPSAVVDQMLRAAEVDGATADPSTSGRTLGCDAVLELVVRDFVAVGAGPLREARWDLEWRLVSTRGGGVIWSWPSRGSWFPRQGDLDDPNRPLDAEPEIVSIGGRAPANYRDAAELVADLHQKALARLPAVSR